MLRCTLVYLIFLASSIAGNAIQVLKCETGVEAEAPIPVNVIVPACEAPPCILKKGETYKVEIDFDVARDTKGLKVVVAGIISGLELPWNGVDEDGCKDILIGSCPLSAGDYLTYGVALKVESFYPTTKLTIKWQIRDDNDIPIWCFHLPAEIKP